MEFLADVKRESGMSDFDLTGNPDWKLNPGTECKISLKKIILPLENESNRNSVENGGESGTEESSEQIDWSDASTEVDTDGYLQLKLLIYESSGIFHECEKKCGLCDNYVQKLWNHLMESHVGKPTDLENPYPTKTANFGAQNFVNEQELTMMSIPGHVGENSSMDVKPVVSPINSPEHVNYFNVINNNLKQEPDDNECQEDPLLKPEDVKREEDIIENAKYTDMHTAQTRTYKGFQCLLCPKSFMTNTHLSRHSLIHTGERPFNCETCGKRFALNYNLTVHKRIHTDDKKFPCNKCGKKFVSKLYLSRHKKIVHTEDKPFKCITCGKGFVNKNKLKAHMATHSLIKPFKCELCGKSFINLYSMSRHKSTHNSESGKPRTRDQ